MELLFSRLAGAQPALLQGGRHPDRWASLTITVLETPGHSEGSVCLVVEGRRDLLRRHPVPLAPAAGTDFAGGDYREMLHSLARLAASARATTGCYPGHDQPTTLDYERRVNPYVRQGMKQGAAAMKLVFRGHDDRYAVEQSLLAFFPEERPVYQDAGAGGGQLGPGGPAPGAGIRHRAPPSIAPRRQAGAGASPGPCCGT